MNKKLILSAIAIIGLGAYFYFANAAVVIDSGSSAFLNCDMQKGLVGHWTMDQEDYNSTTKRLTDKSAYENHGTSNNAAIFGNDRMGNSDAMDFNGTDDYVNCGDIDITQKITIEAWIYSDIIQSGVNRYLVGKRDSYLMMFDHTSLGGCFLVYDTGASLHYTSPSVTISEGVWHHIVGVYDGANIKFYLDGVEVRNNVVGAFNLDDSVYSLSIGYFNAHFDGKIDEVRIYSRALSEEEIKRLYEQYKSKFIIN